MKNCVIKLNITNEPDGNVEPESRRDQLMVQLPLVFRVVLHHPLILVHLQKE